ncbi:NXPE family member 3-like [Ptychodera flava]|uniref:NXPE family member 3-like n=1 Tax=Ptychodera flava TaxID=63121 RepID=UPI003969EF99
MATAMKKKSNFCLTKYSPFAMDWLGLVDELEREYQNTPYGRDKLSHRSKAWSLDTGSGSLGVTSPSKTRIRLQNDGSYFRMGDYIHVVMETFDDNGRPRLRGGDFFEAVMESQSPYRSTAGRVIDYLNGTYSVLFYAAWRGHAVINITMAFSRESMHFLNIDVRQQERRLSWNVVYRRGKKEAKSTCSLLNEGTWSDICEYSIPASIGKSVFLCAKPEKMDCRDIATVKTSIARLDEIANRFNALANNSIFFESHGGPIGTITVNIEGPEKEPLLPRCAPDMPIPLADGFWSSRKIYSSLVCKARQWSIKEFKKCLAGREIVLYGDSTLGQIYQTLGSQFNYTKKKHQFHDFKIGPRDSLFWNQYFTIDVVEDILKEPCNSTVFITNACFHFSSWTTRGNMERLIRTKHALEKMVKKCPDIPVIIKSCNPRENGYAAQAIHSNNWIFYDINRMLRRVLGGMGFLFVDVWDMCLSHFTPSKVHMHEDVIAQEIHLIASYLCPDEP